MREATLIVHFLGLAMGIGTSIGFMFLGIAGSKMEKEERLKFVINTFPLSRMGHIGLTFLVISGLYLMTPFWRVLPVRPLLIAKLAIVLTLIVNITIVSIASNKVKKGDFTKMKQIMVLGRVALLTGLAIVVIAVLVFH